MEFVVTGDGSKTLYHPEVGEHYHSRHGAVQESKHVFLSAGLKAFLQDSGAQNASILEIGFGTGLNFLLSAHYAQQQQVKLHYVGIEAYPLPFDVISQTGYGAFVEPALWQMFLAHYPAALEQELSLCGQNTEWQIAAQKVMDFTTPDCFDVLYFDAFAALHQPEMWSDETLAHVCQFLKPHGLFVTYAITGKLKRSLKALGFTIEKLPGAPGKREMLRATKLKLEE